MKDLDYTFLNEEPEALSDKTLQCLMAESGDFVELHYTEAISCPIDLDISGFKATCMQPLIDTETYEKYLMLSGGGMDMSWYIAEAFYQNGYAPPLYVCKLPAMAGKQTNDDTSIIEACNTSLQTRIDQLTRTLEHNNLTKSVN